MTVWQIFRFLGLVSGVGRLEGDQLMCDQHTVKLKLSYFFFVAGQLFLLVIEAPSADDL